MKNFKDLKFGQKFDGVGSHHTFDNGITLSVQAGIGNYSTPRELHPSEDSYVSFEVAVWDKNNDWITSDIVDTRGDTVAGWVSRGEIDEIISKIDSLSLDSEGKIKTIKQDTNKDLTVFDFLSLIKPFNADAKDEVFVTFLQLEFEKIWFNMTQEGFMYLRENGQEVGFGWTEDVNQALMGNASRDNL